MNVPLSETRLTLPAIPIRDMVLFPNARVPFVVGRRSSVKTLESSIKAGDHLVLLTQKDPKIEEPETEDLFQIGTLALVESLIALPKDYFKVGVKGIARVRLERFITDTEAIQAEVTILQEPPSVSSEATLLKPFRRNVEVFLGRNPDASRLLSMDQIRELPLGKAIDTVAALIPAEVKEKQPILEALEIEPRLDAVQKLLEIDAAPRSPIRLSPESFNNTRRNGEAAPAGDSLTASSGCALTIRRPRRA